MRFNNAILLLVSFFVTLAVGLVIPASTLSSRDLEVREGLDEDDLDLFAREPISLKRVFHVGAGNGRPAQSFTKKEVKQAVQNANTLRSSSKTQQKKNGLKPFQNRPNASKKFGVFSKPFPFSKSGKNSKLHEFPLPNKNPGATGPGPARVILKQTKAGGLKYRGVVSHNQKKAAGSKGHMDHKRVFPRPAIRRKK